MPPFINSYQFRLGRGSNTKGKIPIDFVAVYVNQPSH